MGKCVVFDLDGTLADTSGDLLAAANTVFKAMGSEARLEQDRDAGVAVRGGKAMLTAGLKRSGGYSEALVEEWYPYLLEVYSGALDLHTVMYPGAVASVEALLRDDYKLSICTNKPEALAQKLLVSLGVRDLFGALIGADTLPTRKPDVAPYWAAVERAGGLRGESLLVGDTVTDRKTAQAAGRPCILVTFARGGEDVRVLKPEAVIDHFDALQGEVVRLIG